ncbi:Hsp20 family protein [Halosegnis rubeus]|jgi:HSP20 family molecular chaperone IbpA|uniref:Hsp20 family protein n=1 Tax=Halosegnis rubeus TaxID=2212850 RepID=A0A5N5UB67_9EURY|nr:Hsp20/alpha crystallin family protein [Halosegnis rubeus]KAB7515865.1 Hsp20 family protein [Halosegnis rubeus]KAB7516920.1 Hsp20 family protein [Halosegnis rubeus]KAB7519951.1 Hsp20 family protein [Halosegnis rubeus]
MSALREALGNLPEAVFADLLESDEAYRVVLDLPGVTADTVDVTAEGGRLRIEARRDKDVPTAFRYVTEERSLFLDTELPLPPTVDAPDATATVERGVLTVTLPKTAVTGGTSVPVSDA